MRAGEWLYLAALALLPWALWPPFPWLHEHAQWADVLLAAAVLAWLIERRPRPDALWAAAFAYVGWAAISWALTRAPGGAAKLLGIGELGLLALVSADLATRPRVAQAITQVVGISSCLVGAGAIAGVVLAALGRDTTLCGPWGQELGPVRDVWPCRAQAGFYHPNLLASFCIFADAILAGAPLRRRWHLLARALLLVAAALAISRALLGLLAAAATRTRRGWPLALACAACVIALSVRTLRPGPAPRAQTIVSALATLRAHPLVGSGPGTHPGALEGEPADAHLTPLGIAATLGLPALGAFGALLVVVLRARPRDLALVAGLCGLGVDALGQDVESFRHVWILLGLAYGATRRGAADGS
jgi:hypothetical protein